MDTSRVTRFEVIGNKGIVFEGYVSDLFFDIQDDGLTFKVFIKEDTDEKSPRRLRHINAVRKIFGMESEIIRSL